MPWLAFVLCSRLLGACGDVPERIAERGNGRSHQRIQAAASADRRLAALAIAQPGRTAVVTSGRVAFAGFRYDAWVSRPRFRQGSRARATSERRSGMAHSRKEEGSRKHQPGKNGASEHGRHPRVIHEQGMALIPPDRPA
jgi:hypothetical protein